MGAPGHSPLRAPTIATVDTTLAVAMAAAGGAFLGAAAAVGVGRARLRRASEQATQAPAPPRAPLVDRLLVDSLPLAFVVVGSGDEVLVSNSMARERLLVVGRDISAEPLRALVREARRTRSACHTDHDDGRHAWRASAVPLDDDRIALVADDRTEARRVDEVRRDFVANVGHELKTPVGALALLAEATGDAADDPEAVRRFTGRMQREATRLGRLVQDIIDLSRVQGTDPTAQRGPVQLDAVVAEAVDRAREGAAGKRIELVTGPTSGLVVEGDERQLCTALYNLLDNAVAYSPEDTRVAVGVVPDGSGSVEITVTDQGIGIPLAEQDRIFERFYRVDPARSRDTGGTGLGLAIVKHIATGHGGEVTVWSREGSGSTFTLRLPVPTPAPAPEQQPTLERSER
jgi:two-component system sensor histidine kinase SenX3